MVLPVRVLTKICIDDIVSKRLVGFVIHRESIFHPIKRTITTSLLNVATNLLHNMNIKRFITISNIMNHSKISTKSNQRHEESLNLKREWDILALRRYVIKNEMKELAERINNCNCTDVDSYENLINLKTYLTEKRIILDYLDSEISKVSSLYYDKTIRKLTDFCN